MKKTKFLFFYTDALTAWHINSNYNGVMRKPMYDNVIGIYCADNDE